MRCTILLLCGFVLLWAQPAFPLFDCIPRRAHRIKKEKEKKQNVVGPAMIQIPALIHFRTVVIGPYRVKDLEDGTFCSDNIVSNGSFGLVIKGTLAVSKRQVAVKAIALAELEAIDIENSMNEHKYLKELSGKAPYFLTYEGCDADSKALYLITEYVDGADLFDLIKHNALDKEQLDFAAASVTDAVSYLHEHWITHRDLKPENVLISWKGDVKLADFGFATDAKDKELVDVLGTPGYYAPELLSEKGYGLSADIWSLMCLLVEVWASESLFNRKSEFYRRALTNKECPTSLRLQRKLGTAKYDLIRQLLKYNPKERLTIEEIKKSSAFSKVDFVALRAGQAENPLQDRDPNDAPIVVKHRRKWPQYKHVANPPLYPGMTTYAEGDRFPHESDDKTVVVYINASDFEQSEML